MNKKLVAVAVAGLFAAPAVALAQSSVTISGAFKGGYENQSYGNSTKANDSQHGVVDDSSRILFNVTEDLGGGLAAIGQLDVRFSTDQGAIAASGNTFYGLRSKQWGQITFGRNDLHYFNTEGDMPTKASLRTSQVGLLAYAGAGTVAMANATRTTNVVRYLSPNWSGFTFILAYSSSPVGAAATDSDIGSGVSKGSGWNFQPNYQAKNWQVGWSHWEAKPDAAANTLAAGKQKADRVYGSYVFPMGLKIGLAWDSSKIDGQNVPTGVAQAQSKRDAWSLPISYTWGNHSVHFHYTDAGNDKRTSGVDDGADMYALSYAYDLSKRTSMAISYARIDNDSGARYNFFTSVGLGVGGVAPTAGEDPKMWGVTLRHNF
jgi:predicted porin